LTTLIERQFHEPYRGEHEGDSDEGRHANEKGRCPTDSKDRTSATAPHHSTRISTLPLLQEHENDEHDSQENVEGQDCGIHGLYP
jgi:hypothetical protein